jgi:hypothetical protein
MADVKFKEGDRVRFLPSPRTTVKVAGKVTAIETKGEGRGKSTFLVVACDDERERRIRPGACTAA